MRMRSDFGQLRCGSFALFCSACLLVAEAAADAGAYADLVLHTNGSVRVLEITDGASNLATRIGALLCDQGGTSTLSTATLDYFSSAAERKVSHAYYARHFAPFLLSIARCQAETDFNGLPEARRLEMTGFAAGIGMDLPEFAVTLYAPDLGATHGKAKYPSFRFGCTSVAGARPGEFAIGRNLDFPGVGAWDRHPLVVVRHAQAAGAGIDRVAFTTDGLHLASISGVNRAGLFLAVHQMFTADRDRDGLPVYLVGDEVLRTCRSIPEALAHLASNRPQNIWTFVLADVRSNLACSVEVSPTIRGANGLYVRAMEDGVFAQANHLSSPVLKQRERISSGNLYNSQHRQAVAERLMRQALVAGDDLGTVARRILAYQENADGRLALHHDILKAETIQSIVLHHVQGRTRALLAIEEAPTAGGRFAEIDIDMCWTNVAQAIGPIHPPLASPEARDRQRGLARAHVAIDDDFHPREALRLLPDDGTPSASLIRMTLWLQAGDPERASEEVRSFGRCLEAGMDGWTGVPAHIAAGANLCGAIAAAKLHDMPLAHRYAQRILDDGIADPYHGVVARKILRAKLAPPLDPPAFDFFAGALRPGRYVLDDE